jgi:5-deoxy-glucuronate isomerase
MPYDADNMIIHPNAEQDDGVVTEVTPVEAQWDYINFQTRRLPAGETWSSQTTSHELAIVLLGGTVDVDSDRGRWEDVGERDHVFEAPASTLYLPRMTNFKVQAASDAEFGVASVPTDEDHPPQLVAPEDVQVEIRGGDNVTRQINDIIQPGFDCDRLVLVEVYTPSGGWSSYPPHKHDVHREDEEGTVEEADLEEIYYYKIDKPEGFAFQRIYTDPESPLHKAGHPIDEVLLAQNDDIVLVPEGYHPVVSAPGYTTYYLNVLAGSAQSLANSDDPNHTWVKDQYTTKNPALPVYDLPGA